MNILAEPADWREGRRRAARDAILRAAWTLVDEEGLAGLSLRDLARRAGITTPTVYTYFESKNAIYDAMFGQAAAEFVETMAEPLDGEGPHEILVAYAGRFVEFCTDNPTRYQLLFQRTLPGFEPSPGSFAPAIRALAHVKELLAVHGIAEERHIDLWTALFTGLVDQQISNDPGGDRWTRLVDESVTMLLAQVQSNRVAQKRSSRTTRTRGSRS